ncbi:MAG: hypothetical protein KGN32_00345 [Burkholderiales bacterium]|nr:hypothetical protein [Burkholderiales bacterium]
MRLRNSFWALLGHDTYGTQEVVIERIRAAMLTALETHCDSNQYAVEMRLSFARDVAELWYLRPDLMNAIAACQSECVAQTVMESITDLFRGYHPGPTPSRFGRL